MFVFDPTYAYFLVIVVPNNNLKTNKPIIVQIVHKNNNKD